VDFRGPDEKQTQICPNGHEWDPIQVMLNDTYIELCRVVQRATDIERVSEELRVRSARLAFKLNLLLKRL
jgi:hypothetical protein